ncbi:MAG: nucleotidyltransferase family protein [Cyanobacteria bacterium M_surface_7_m2_040]|nr:nucleotidyltransferase family protein [Cyanobacteria bacterium M_surface_7_m2_040]
MRLSELQALSQKLRVIAERYGAFNIAVFGSVARDEATEASDIDLLVDLPQGTSLFQRAEFQQDLEALLDHKVDLIRRRNLRPSLRDRVEAEAVPLA